MLFPFFIKSFIYLCMKRFMLYLFFLFTIFGCSELKEDNPETLPFVNTSNYIYGNYIKFPLNTPALDIYATLNKKFGPGEHSVTGTGWITKTVTIVDDTYTETKEVNISKIKLYTYTTEAGGNAFCVTIYTDEESITLKYIWQYKNDNVWENTILNQYNIRITF